MAALAADLAAPRARLAGGGGMPSIHAGLALAGPAAVSSTVAGSCMVCDETKPAWSASTGDLVHCELHRQLNEFNFAWRELERRLSTGNDYARHRQQETRADERRLSEDVLR